MHEEKFNDKITIMVLQGPNSVCAYLGMPKDHPTAGKHYDDVDLDCHGGLTFGKVGDGNRWDKHLYWYGWDYSHAGDALSGPGMSLYRQFLEDKGEECKLWTAEEALEEARNVAPQLQSIMEKDEQGV